MKISYLKPTSEKIAFIRHLSRVNFDTKFGTGSHLQYLVDVDLDLCFSLSKQYINGKDWRLWQSLNLFISYLNKFHEDKRTKDFLEELLMKFGIYKDIGQNKNNELLENAIDIIVDNTFERNSKKYLQ